jgi:hypothetical protein
LALCALLLLTLDSAIRIPNSAFEYANFFMDDTLPRLTEKFSQGLRSCFDLSAFSLCATRAFGMANFFMDDTHNSHFKI